MTDTHLGAPSSTAPTRFTRTPAKAALHLWRLHLSTRNIPAAAGIIALCAGVLRVALWQQWTPHSHPEQLPLAIEAGIATVIAVTSRSPIGEPERVTGRWLPYLRLATALVLTAAAIGMLAAATIGADLPSGILAIPRNIAGLAGIAFLAAAALGGSLAWIGPVLYWTLNEFAFLFEWNTPWTIGARLPHDRGAAICASVIFATGIAITTLCGAGDSAPD